MFKCRMKYYLGYPQYLKHAYCDYCIRQTSSPEHGPRSDEFIWHDAVDTALEEVKQWEPDSGAFRVHLHEGSVVRQRMIIKEEPRRDVEGDKDIDRVMFVCRENEKYSEQIDDPRQRMQIVIAARRVLSDEEIKQSEHCRVAGEHVVATGANPLNQHTATLRINVQHEINMT